VRKPRRPATPLRRPARRTRITLERLEDRTLLNGSNIFAQFSGAVPAAGSVQQIPITLSTSNFTLPGRQVVLGFEVQAPDGSSLDPAAVTITTSGGAVVNPTYVNADVGGTTASLVLASLTYGSYNLAVHGDRGTSGAFQLDAFVAGDANGDHQIDLSDGSLIRSLIGSVSGDGRYLVAADSNLDGEISSFDYTEWRYNLNDATSITPLALSLKTPPGLVQLPAGSLATATAAVTLSGTTNPGATVALETGSDGMFDDGSTTADSSGDFSFGVSLTAGANNLQVKASDTFGQQQTASLAILLDTQAPTVTVTSPARGLVTNSNLTLAGQVTDNLVGVAALQAAVDGGAYAPVSFDTAGDFSLTTALPLDHSADGPHAVHLRATDLVGNVSPATDFAFTLDTTPPVVTVTSPAPGLTVNQNITVAGQVTDALSGVASADAALDGGAFAPLSLDTAGNFAFTTDLPLDDTADGPHTIHIRAADRAGNVSAVTDFTFSLEVCATLANAVVAQSGGSPAGQGSVTINDCDATLREGDSFDVTLSLPIAIPAQASTLNFNYSDLAFDTTSQGRVKDAFEVALVDASGNSLVPTVAANRDAFLNVTEGQPVALGAWATGAGQTVALDVSHVTPGTAATLVFRLVNNDGDVNTSVVVGSVRVAPLLGQPADPGGQPGAAAAPPSEAIDFAHLADVSASVQPVYGRTSFDQPASVLYAELAAQNAGQYFVDAPLIVAIDHLSDPTVVVRGADGMTPDGLPYFDLSALVPGGKLAAGESTGTQTLAFYDPSGVPFTYDLVFLGYLNRPPQFTSTPNREALVGKAYVYDATATDPDNDALTFSLLSGPAGMTVDASTGTVSWSPAGTDVGNAAVALKVDDGHGGSVEQDFTLSVINPPPDRPPVFTTTPVVDANVDAPYAYQAQATDPDSDPLTFSVVVGPEGLTIDPTSGLVQWSPAAAQLGPNSVTLQVADGRGGSAVQSYTIEVGQQAGNLAPYITSKPVTSISLPQDLFVGGFYSSDVTEYTTEGVFVRTVVPSGSDGLDGIEAVRFGPDGMLYIGDTTSIRRFDPNTGAYLGVFATGFSYATDIAFDRSGDLFASDYQHDSVKEFSPDGTLLRTFDMGGQTVGLLFEPDGKLLVVLSVSGPDRNTVAELDPQTGDTRTFATNLSEPEGIAVGPDGRYYVGNFTYASSYGGFDPDTIYVVGPDGGIAQRWNTSQGDLDGTSNVIFINNKLFVTSEYNGEVVEFDAATGNYVGSFSAPGGPQGIALPVPTLYTYQVRAIDPDSDPLTYSLVTAPSGMTIDPQSGLIRWLPTEADQGQQPVTVRVDDGRGGFDTQSYTIDLIGSANTGTIDGTVLSGPASSTPPSTALVTSSADLPANGSLDWGVLGPNGTQVPNPFSLPVEGIAGLSVNVSKQDTSAFERRDSPIGWSGAFLPGDELLWTKYTGSDITLTFNHPIRGIGFQVQEDSVSDPPPPLIDRGPFTATIEAFDSSGNSLGKHAESGRLDNPEDGSAILLGESSNSSDIQQIVIKMSDNNSYADFAINHLLIEADSPLAGWSVYLDQNHNGLLDPGEPTTTTDANGNYSFTNLAPGTYTVAEVGQPGWTQTEPVGGTYTVTVAAGQNVNGIDFGNTQLNPPPSRPPTITSTPPAQATVGQRYQYQAVVDNPDGQDLTFDLPFRPAGMAVDPQTGVVVWTPTADEVGAQSALLRARDARGDVVLQDLSITVAQAGTPPVITSTPPAQAYVGLAYEYDVHAQTASGGALAYSLQNAPAGMAVDPSTGVLTWVPTAGELGAQTAALTVEDSAGNQASQTIDVIVSASAPASTPVISSTPPTTVRLGNLYWYPVQASDPSGAALIYTLVAAPAGMTVDTTGLIQWRPSAGQLGSNPVTLEVDNGHGGTAGQSFTVNATNLFTPLPPVITSTPPASAVVGNPYAHNLTAIDPGGYALLWSLDTAPVGMSIDPTLGTVRWTPTADEIGAQAVTVRVTDGLGQATQSFSIAVHGVDVPPLITSEPPTQGAVGSTYNYQVAAQYTGAGALSYALTTKPAGMTIDPASGLIQWTPTADEVGSDAVALSVTDPLGGGATQTFTVVVAATPPILPPTITSQPAFVGTAGALYQYAVLATDPAGLALSYSLAASPAGMTVDPASGLVNWTPISSQAGPSVVTVVATNTGDAAASQTFTVVVSVNHPPVINSTALTSITAGSTYRYDVKATDPDGDPLTYSLLTGPAGMSIDALGRLTWTTSTANVGTQHVSIAVADNHGASVAQLFDVNVVADTQPPQVALSVTPSPANLGSQVTFLVTAVDNVKVQSLELTINGVPVALDSSGRATVTMTTAGDLAVVATATDPAGNTGTASSTLTVINPSVTNPPTVSFDTPADGDVITAPTAVIGSVSDSNLLYYTLSVAPVGSDAFTEIARGTSPVSHGTLGTFDPSLLSNDSYVLRLYAKNTGGYDTTLDQVVSVAGNLKLGDFRLSFTDLTLAVAGIPITVTRTYDSLNANSSEDFGYGWTLQYLDTDLQTSVPKTGSEADLIYNPFTEGTRVYVTLPGGERQGFTFRPTLAPGFAGSFLGIYDPSFVPDAGVTSQLSVADADLMLGPDGQFYSYADGTPYNASSPAFGGVYTLSTKEGLAYAIDGNSGKLMTATDAHGNTLTFSDAGITSSAGPQVTFDRDPQGRIVAVTDPAGNKVQYQYNASGDLVAVTDRQGNTTQFVYNASQAHYLTQVIDPLGNTGVRTNYDAQGRLTTLTDAAGKTVSLGYDPTNSTEVVTDQLGNPTTYVYDDRGNIVSQTDALGGVTTRTYDAANNMLTQTDPLGRTTTDTYDAQGNVLTETDPLGNITRHTYTSIQLYTNLRVPLAPISLEATTTDPLGNTTTNAYDSQGNLLSETDALGHITSFAYDASGDPTSLTDADGSITSFTYDGAGRLLTQTDALGHVTFYTYDANGNQTSQTTTLTTPAGVRTLVTSTEYDTNGRAIEVTDAEGNVTRTEYDAAGNMTATIDALGRRTQYVYDDRGKLIETIYPDGTTTQTECDAAGNVTAQVDEQGRRTVMKYDALGRLVETDNPGGSSTKTAYDAAGQVTAQVDELGNGTVYTYDAAGQQTSVTDALGNVTADVYDTAGNLVAETDPLGHTTRFVVDALGRQVETDYADGTKTSVVYDAAGRAVSRTDQAGRTTGYEYDALGHLTAVVDALGQRTQYAYDEAGDLVSQTDANGRVTTYEYNGLGERTATVLPMGQRSTTVYDAAGEVTSTTDFNGATTTYAYDARGRLTAEDFPDGTSVIYTYTADGQRATATDSRGLTSYSYDARDRLVSRTDPDGTTISYTYDAAGNRTSVTTPAGTTSYTFDALNRTATVTDPSGGVTKYSYDAAGNLTETDFPNGTKEIRQYDTLNRLVYLEDDGPSGVISSYTYTLSPTRLQDSVVENTGRRVDYGYDALDRLTSETITDASAGNRTIVYTYDAVGNRLTMNDSTEGLTTSTYDANDRLLTETLNGQVTQYTYDNNGNTLSQVTSPTDQTDYHWDSQNRLIEADVTTASGTTQTLYQYDVDGIRVSQSTAGEETRYLIDTVQPYAQVLLEYRPSGLIVASYVYGNALISQNRGGVFSYYLVDALGSTRALTNAGGVVTDRYVYDAFGRMIGQTGNTVNSYLFAGQQRDAATGLDYLRARYMDDESGRFNSKDTFSGFMMKPSSLNSYMYASDEPVLVIDPSGHDDLLSVIGGIGIASILAAVSARYFGPLTSGSSIAGGVQAVKLQLSIADAQVWLNNAEVPDNPWYYKLFDSKNVSTDATLQEQVYATLERMRLESLTLTPFDFVYNDSTLAGVFLGSSDAFAYVANLAKPIYVRPGFFDDAALKQSRVSRGGILVHELAHLAGVTGDKYGLSPALYFARTDPAFASNNADNFMFFVELSNGVSLSKLPRQE